jgi:hypothetical protein
MSIKKYYIDRRVFKSGKSNRFLNVAETEDLNDLVSQIVLNSVPGLPQLPLLFNNAIQGTYTAGIGTEVQWGGSLVRNTTVNGGNTYDAAFRDMTGFAVVAPNTGNISLEAQQGNMYLYGKNTTTLWGASALNIRTPQHATKPTGAILRMTTPVTGTTEFTSYGLPATDGTIGQILVTDGAGTVSWTTATGTITGADNGLNITGVEVYLGGTLVQDTAIDGDTLYDLKMTDLSEYVVTSNIGSVSGVTSMTVSSPNSLALTSLDELSVSGTGNLFISTPNVVATTAATGAIMQLTDDASGEVEYTPYALPLTDGNPGEVLVTDGFTNVTWQSPKCEVIHFTNNPSNTSYPDDALGGIIVETFNIGANTLSSNGSYLEVEYSVNVSGVSGDIPTIETILDGLSISSFTSSADHSYTQVVKSKIIRVSPTTYFSQSYSEFYSAGNVFIESKLSTASGTVDWTTSLPLEINFDLGTGNHTSEVLHFLVTKFLK